MRPDPWDKSTYSSPIHDYKRAGPWGAHGSAGGALLRDLRGPDTLGQALGRFLQRIYARGAEFGGVFFFLLATGGTVVFLISGTVSTAAWILVLVGYAIAAALILVARTLDPDADDR